MLAHEYDIRVREGNPFRIPTVRIYDMSPYGGPASLAEPGVSVSARIIPKANPAAVVEMDVEVLDPLERRVRVLLPPARATWGSRSATWELRVKKEGTSWDVAVLSGNATLLRAGS